jgi:signal transduction histidine kinase
MEFYRNYIKKKKYIVINGLITVVLLGIIANQTVWLVNVYSLFEREFKANANATLQNATYMELTERGEILGGVSFYSRNSNSSSDTSRFLTKKIVTEDSTYIFTIDKNDPNFMHKISQFMLKQYFPVNLNRLSAIFKENIPERYAVSEAYFDYFDLENDTLINTNRPENMRLGLYVLTDTIPLDIIHSIGVMGYIGTPHMAILDNMKRQLLLSVLLIAIGVISLFYISRSFIFQWKTEKMRQDSVNAMTHEFKRPVSTAVALASIIPFYLEKKETDRVLEYVGNIEIALNKLTYYIKRIQQISNNEKGNVALDKTAVEIIPFFESLQQRYTLSGDEHEQKISVKLQFDTSKRVMAVDLLHFSNVMDNLVENAIKYTVRPSAIIDITVADMADGLKISVKDNGIGISPADKKHIFDKFYRIKREETKNKIGLGLGLTYVKSIVEAHGGDITVNSILNEGSEFIILLKN